MSKTWRNSRRDTNMAVTTCGSALVAIALLTLCQPAAASDTVAFAWGGNDYGELGIGSRHDRRIPQPIINVSSVTAIAGGTHHSLGIDSNGQLWAWGLNSSGQLGIGSTNFFKTEPTAVSGLSSREVVAVAAGYALSVALTSENDGGEVYAWGYNKHDRLGIGSGLAQKQRVPVPVLGLADIAAITAGYEHALALRSDGTVWAFGINTYGQLGNGEKADWKKRAGSAVQVTGLSEVIAIATGRYHSLALRSDGTVWAWGRNSYGQLGTGDTELHTVPTQVALLSGAKALAAGEYHSVALLADGTLRAWGAGTYGVLGNGQTQASDLPVQVTTQRPISAVSCRYYHCFAIDEASQLWVWGQQARSSFNADCQSNNALCVGDNALIPALVQGIDQVVAVAAGHYHVLALQGEGSEPVAAFAMGDNGHGQLGAGEQAEWLVHVAPVEDVVDAAAGKRHSLILDSQGTVWSSGLNFHGQLGSGSFSGYGEGRNQAAPVAGLESVVAVAAGAFHSLALDEHGRVFSWGSNYKGQLGTGTRTSSPTPQLVGGLSKVTAIAAAGHHSLALTEDGRVLGWGHNNHGQLGTGNQDDSLTPTLVTGLDGVATLAAGSYHNLAVRTDGTVWAWGYDNDYDLLGTGQSGPALAPQQVFGLATVVAVAAGLSHSLALYEDGSVRAWGFNGFGKLGLDTWRSVISVPQQISGLAKVVSIVAGSHHCLAVLEGGELVGWGLNDEGQIGLSEQSNARAPQPTGVTSALAVAAGSKHTLVIAATD